MRLNILLNNYIISKLDHLIRGVNTELQQKVLLQVPVRELHIDMLKRYATGFSMEYHEKGLFRISGYDLWLIFLPQLKNMTQSHQIICGFKIFIQAGT